MVPTLTLPRRTGLRVSLSTDPRFARECAARHILTPIYFMFSYYFLLALMFASIAGHDAIVSVLLQNAASGLVRNQLGLNVLHLAASNGYTAVVQRLIDHNANLLRWTDNQGQTILHFMSFGGHWDAIDPWFERLGMDDKTMIVRQDDAQGNNALPLAVCARRLSGVLMFLSFASSHQIVRAQSIVAHIDRS
jgi:hypothetical protein